MFPTIYHMIKFIGWLPENYPNNGPLMNTLIQYKKYEIEYEYYKRLEVRLTHKYNIQCSSPSYNVTIKNII